jgi:hypothetical protein
MNNNTTTNIIEGKSEPVSWTGRVTEAFLKNKIKRSFKIGY